MISQKIENLDAKDALNESAKKTKIQNNYYSQNNKFDHLDI